MCGYHSRKRYVSYLATTPLYSRQQYALCTYKDALHRRHPTLARYDHCHLKPGASHPVTMPQSQQHPYGLCRHSHFLHRLYFLHSTLTRLHLSHQRPLPPATPSTARPARILRRENLCSLSACIVTSPGDSFASLRGSTPGDDCDGNTVGGDNVDVAGNRRTLKAVENADDNRTSDI